MHSHREICRLITNPNTSVGRGFAVAVQILILVSLFSFALSTTPNIPPKLKAFLWWEQFAVIVLFTIEYAIRLLAAPNKACLLYTSPSPRD